MGMFLASRGDYACGLFDATFISTTAWQMLFKALHSQLFLADSMQVTELRKAWEDYDADLSALSCSSVVHPLLYSCPLDVEVPLPPQGNGGTKGTRYFSKMGALFVMLLAELGLHDESHSNCISARYL